MDPKILRMLNDHEVMAVALMIPEEEVLTMGGIYIFPVLTGLLYRCHRGMLIIVEWNVKLF
jgi:hypothetical protein